MTYQKLKPIVELAPIRASVYRTFPLVKTSTLIHHLQRKFAIHLSLSFSLKYTDSLFCPSF